MGATLGAVVLAMSALAAQAPQVPSPGAAAAAVVTQGPPAPVAPAVINRDATGKATVRATRITTPLKLDGKLDEAVYTSVPAMSDFIQNDPKPGAPATEKTEAWVFYDDKNFYVVARCWESHPELLIANEMRRDNRGIVENDQFAWGLDTFFDHRNMLIFEVSARGGRIDGQVTNERQVSLDWNPIWQVKTSRFDQGYVVEAALPFKSLRYKPGRDQVWGIQLRRRNMAKNEYSYLTPIPPSVGSQGHFRAALAAPLVGLEVPNAGRVLDIKPFITAAVNSDKTARPVIDNDFNSEVGVDAKVGLTQGITADLTVNTDFAQVEADEQQVNLTRFNLFFPEKRDFFLENAGVFAFGSNSATTGGDTPVLFYSRSIGLSNGREVPIRAGGRVSGRAGKYTIGAVNVQSGEEPIAGTAATNFTVLRVRRDISGRNNIGAILTNRSASQFGPGSNQVYGADANFAVGADLSMTGYWVRSETEGRTEDRDSYRAFLDYNADRWGLQGEHLLVGRQYNAEMGFARRLNMRKNLGMARFSPRPKKNTVIRKYWYQATGTRITDTDGRLESRSVDANFQIQYQNQDIFTVGVLNSFEFLPRPFVIAPGVVLPVAEYDFNSARIGYNFGRQRKISGNLLLDYGEFYNGNKTTFTITSGRLALGPQLSVEPSFQYNKVDVTQGAFTNKLLTSRVTYTMTPWMFVSALLQYNSGTGTLASNIRFRWEYTPGSEMFVVYNETGDTRAAGFPDRLNRTFVVKVNRVFRF